MNKLFLLGLFVILFSPIALGQPKQVLSGHLPAFTKALDPTGKLDGATILDLVIGLPLRNEARLSALIEDMYNSKSKNYRKFLTPSQFTEQFSPDKKGFDEVVNFARKNKLIIGTLPSNLAYVHVKGTAQQIEKAFNVKLLTYINPNTKLPFYATDRDPTVNIASRILHIAGLDNIAESLPIGAHSKLVGSGTGGSYRGNDFRNAFAPGVTLTGTGQTVGLLSFSDFSDVDMQTYELVCGLPDVTIRRVFLNGLKLFNGVIPPAPPTGFDSELEISLDIQMAMSMAPGASITVYGVPSAASTAIVLNEMANPSQGEPLPNQLSSSFATNYGTDSTIYKLFLQMAVQGQTFFGFSGDNGAYADNASTPGPLPFAPGDYPYVTSVGGTVLNMNGNGVSYNSEMTWSSGGGGPSPWFSIEKWQIPAVNSTNSGNKSMRNCPDVSMPASNIYNISHAGVIGTVAGTSASSPLWAGFMALVNEQAQRFGRPPIGFLNPALYAIGSSGSYHDCFNDITTGNNSSSGNPAKYTATKGYDLATGWGSPRGINLINALALRMPDVIDISLSYQGRSTSGCDPGPVAGSIAAYHVQVNTGQGPYTYNWSATGLSFVSGNTSNSSTVIVNVPLFGSSGELNVTVTDANGTNSTVSVKVAGLDPALRIRMEKLCILSHEFIYHYISPNLPFEGDPVPFWRNQRADFTPAELRELSDLLSNMMTAVKSLQDMK